MRKTTWKSALLAIAVVLMASCSPRSEYVNVLPKDAAMVVSVDLKTMADKSGINGKEGEQVVAKLKDALKSGLEGEAGKMAEKIVENPSESGLALTEEVYLFVTPHANAFGLVAKMESESKLKDLLQALQQEQICTAPKSESGCTWVQMGSTLCVFNRDAFLLVGREQGDALDLKDTLLAWMRQDAAGSFASTSDFDKLSRAKGEICAVTNLSFIPNELTMQMRMGMPADLKLEDIKYLLSVCFENGKIVVDAETLTENKALVELYERQMKCTSPIKGSYMEYFPASTLFWMGGNIDGASVYDMLCENATIRQALESPMLPVDIRRIFSAIQGDIALGYHSITGNELLMYADVTNKDFLQAFEDLRPLLALTGGQMKLISTGQDQYEFRMYRQSIWFGVKDNSFYLSNNERLADEAGRRYGASLQNTPWAKDVKQNRVFMAFNAAQLAKDINGNPMMRSMMGSGNAALAGTVLNACDYIDLMAPDWKGGQMNIVMKDKDTNVLKQILRGLENL